MEEKISDKKKEVVKESKPCTAVVSDARGCNIYADRKRSEVVRVARYGDALGKCDLSGAWVKVEEGYVLAGKVTVMR